MSVDLDRELDPAQYARTPFGKFLIAINSSSFHLPSKMSPCGNPDGTKDVIGGFHDEEEARAWLAKNASTARKAIPFKPLR
ncbi:hypothetical protein XH98_14745 [Bradyrhizobium sp. CCBAU 51745]|uniref:hypothetical protein n=1 Tax=Bradyrhizobium sp. CCBAU 51745 TaxID=1325099 RepID=UPI002305B4DC|nr:hypothetical protein [Bradyrhizobium sp. CCBAU 51745]MDA9440354.1 hypothetical protein [Bradyrhizobium sp. CCBAU 51745]